MIDIAVTLALRQDALVAADRPASSTNRLDVARTIAEWPSDSWLRGDWPLAVPMTAPRSATGEPRRELQHDVLFLAAAYPDAYQRFIEESATHWKVPPEQLYAVVRTETAFNPTAESKRAALGLFQFIPSTFRDLNAEWRLVDSDDRGETEAFLLAPETNLQLGARWFAEMLLKGQDGNILWALMAHNAGPGTVSQWKVMWRRLGRADDLEFMVETAPLRGDAEVHEARLDDPVGSRSNWQPLGRVNHPATRHRAEIAQYSQRARRALNSAGTNPGRLVGLRALVPCAAAIGAFDYSKPDLSLANASRRPQPNLFVYRSAASTSISASANEL